MGAPYINRGSTIILIILSLMGLVLNRCILLVRRRVLFWDVSEKAAEAEKEGIRV